MSESKQAGFSLMAVLVAVALVAVMASIAVPKFSSTITKANTAKIQSDLSTLDAAIAVYELEKGREPGNIDVLSDYVNDLESLKPPRGKCMLKNGDIITLDDNASYSLKKSDDKSKEGTRAVCADHTAGEFGNGK